MKEMMYCQTRPAHPAAGKASRSLQAAYLALNNDLLPASSVLHLERGIYGAFQAGLDIEGEYKPQVGHLGVLTTIIPLLSFSHKVLLP